MKQIHCQYKPFQCEICGRTFGQKSNAFKHLSSHKAWPKGITRTLPPDGTQFGYLCPYCPVIAQSHPKLRTHLKQHADRKMYICIQPQCTEMFIEIELLRQHVQKYHPEPIYRCFACSETFQSLDRIAEHQIQHGTTDILSDTSKKNQKYVCDTCKSSFTCPEHLQHHLNTVSHEYKCSKCEKVFTCERTLRRHLATHSDPKSLCPVCRKGFKTAQYLKVHMTVHSTIKSHVCVVCQLAFSRKDRLQRHMLIHETNKKFKCPLAEVTGCTKQYHRADKLKLHLKSHTKALKKCSKEQKEQNNTKTVQVVIIPIDDDGKICKPE